MRKSGKGANAEVEQMLATDQNLFVDFPPTNTAGEEYLKDTGTLLELEGGTTRTELEWLKVRS